MYQEQHKKPDGWWREAYEFLAALYPQHQRSEAVYSAYETALSGCDRAVLRGVVAKAPKFWPKWFPSAGELLFEVGKLTAKRTSATAPPQVSEPYTAPDLPADNPYEKLAQQWAAKAPPQQEAIKLLAGVASRMAPTERGAAPKRKPSQPGPWVLTMSQTPSLNEVKRHAHAGQHWWHKRLRDAWETEAYAQRLQTGFKGPLGKMRVEFTRLYDGQQKEFDQDNLIGGAKGMLDALVSAGWLLGDTPALVEVEYHQQRGPRGVQLVLSEAGS